MNAQKILLGFVLLAAGVAAADQPLYRLTAVVVRADAQPMALIELPGHKYRRLQVGDVFYDGTVTEITADEVRIQFTEGERTLRLQSGAVDAPALHNEPGEPLTIDGDRLRSVLDRALRPMLREKAWQGEAQVRQLGELIGRFLGIPEGVLVVEIDGVTADSEESPAQQLAEILADGRIIGLTIANDSERDRIYLTPDQLAGELWEADPTD